MRILAVAVVATTWLAPQASNAHSEKVESIRGEGVQIQERNHAWAGSFGDTLFLGGFGHGEGPSHLRVNRKKVSVEAKINDQSGQEEVRFDAPGLPVIKWRSFNSSENVYEYQVGDETWFLKVDGEYKDRHFQAPKLTLVSPTKSWSLQFTGKSCRRYTLFIGLMLASTAAFDTKSSLN